MNANDDIPPTAAPSAHSEAEALSTHSAVVTTHAIPISSSPEPQTPHSRSEEEMEEGQVRIHVQQQQQQQQPPAADEIEDREESAGAIRMPFDDLDSSADEESDEEEREIDILLREDDASTAAPHILVAPAAAFSAPPLPLLHVNRPDENAVGASQSLVSTRAPSLPAQQSVLLVAHSLSLSCVFMSRQWSLPLPPRVEQPATSAPAPALPSAAAAASSSQPEADLRSRLLALNLPAHHVDLVLQRHFPDAPSSSIGSSADPISAWVERVMESMYEDEQKQKQQVAPQPASVIAPVAPASSADLVVSAPLDVTLAAPAVSSSAPICGICFDPIVSADPPLLSTPCHHPFCGPCWNGFLATRVLEGAAVLAIRCPHADPAPCTRLLSAEEVKQRLTSSDLRARYDRQCELARLAQDPSVRWCPTPSCETILRGGSVAQPHLRCDRCRAELCFKCSERWHPHSTCAEASAASLAQLLGGSSGSLSSTEELKRCPSCSMGIVRSTGCNFLRCSRCDFEFCWLCLGEYSDNHFACQ